LVEMSECPIDFDGLLIKFKTLELDEIPTWIKRDIKISFPPNTSNVTVHDVPTVIKSFGYKNEFQIESMIICYSSQKK